MMTEADKTALVESMRLAIAKTQYGCNDPDDGDFLACIRRVEHTDGSNPCSCWLAACDALEVALPEIARWEREKIDASKAAWEAEKAEEGASLKRVVELSRNKLGGE